MKRSKFLHIGLITALILLPIAFAVGQPTGEWQKNKAGITQRHGKKYHYQRKKSPHTHRWVWWRRKQYTSIGININAMNYFGDIVPKPDFLSTDIRATRPNVSIFVQKRYFPNFTGRLMLSYGRIMGADSITADPKDGHDFFRYIRNLHFRNDIIDFTAMGKYDLVDESRLNKVFYDRPRGFIPYVMGGIGVFYHNPQAKAPEQFGNGDEWVDLREIGTEGQGRTYTDPVTGEEIGLGDPYSNIQVCLPVGFGVRKRISQRIDISFEVNWRFMLTDYLDDLSKDYLNKGVFGDDALAEALHDRSMEGNREAYLRQMAADGDLVRVPDVVFIHRVGTDPNDPNNYYRAMTGFGEDRFPDNIRGNRRDRDVYITTGFHLIYIIPKDQVRCPIRFR